MSYSTKTLKTAYHLAELIDSLEDITSSELNDLAELFGARKPDRRAEAIVQQVLDAHLTQQPPQRAKDNLSFEQFRFEIVMNRLRNVVMHAPNSDDAAEIDWLLKMVLASPAVFSSVREVDNFLANMTGEEHSTKSTGRDRIIEWYMKYISTLSREEQNGIYFKIAKYIFANAKSNYKEWKDILYSGGSR